MTLRLVSLDCPSCGSALHGEGLDTIFFCDHCGDAATLGEDGLEMVESAALMPAPGRSARTWRPAWLIEAEITISGRMRHRSGRRDGWSEERTFVIPAFEMPLGDLTRIARAFSELAGDTGDGSRGSLSQGDDTALPVACPDLELVYLDKGGTAVIVEDEELNVTSLDRGEGKLMVVSI